MYRMCEINPEHKKYVRGENCQKVLYMLVLRVIYGCIESALQRDKLYSETLMEKVFELNPYDICVVNKMMNDKQCTLVSYVDDNKVSHMEARGFSLKKIIKVSFKSESS